MNGKSQESISVGNKLSIEHVMPQAWQTNWENPKDGIVPSHEDWEDYNELEYRDHMLHTIGNITLMTQSLNSKNSNLAYDKKKPLITKESKLLMNGYFQDQNSWDENEIIKRGKILYDLALKVWSKPS
jgi:hypothetical protein